MTSAGLTRQPSLGLNVVANYAGKLWSIASVYVFVPVYIRILGIDAYGLIAFNAIALALLFVADAGLSSSFAREAAKGRPAQELLDVLTSVERVLITILLVIGMAFSAFASVIADHWLPSAGALDRQVVIQALQIMPLALVPQIAMSLYFGGLMGLQRQVTANLLSTTFNVVRSGLVILPIYFLSDIRVFFAWQALSSIALVLVMRATLIRQIQRNSNPDSISQPKLRGKFSAASLVQIRTYALGMLGMSIVAGLNTQLDKLVVSKMLPLAEFAQYSLASTLAQIPYILTLPIASALLPRFTNLLETGHQRELENLYRKATYYIAAIGSITGIALCLFVGDAMSLWLSGRNIDPATIGAARLLALGGALMTFQMAPFQLSLAHGHNATNVRLGVVMLTISIPLQIVLTAQYGAIGAALPWLVMNAFAFVFLGLILNSKFSVVSPRIFFANDTLPAVAVAAVALGVLRLVVTTFETSALTNCVLAAFVSLLAFASAHILRRRGKH